MQSDRAAAALYLDLLERCLTDTLRPDCYVALDPPAGGLIQSAKRVAVRGMHALLGQMSFELVRRSPNDPAVRLEGEDWPARGETMIGNKRLSQLRTCIEEVLSRNIPGDLIECGVWRGGATIFMRGVLKALGDTHRQVWVADSFRGLPPPDAGNYPHDRGDLLFTEGRLAVSLEQVKANFSRYGLLDGQVQFLPGWFKDSLPVAPVDRLAVLRADGDLYESTIQILTNLYPKLSAGGYCIVDDYGALPGCRHAVDDYRRDHGISEPLQWIDWTGVYWRREAPA